MDILRLNLEKIEYEDLFVVLKKVGELKYQAKKENLLKELYLSGNLENIIFFQERVVKYLNEKGNNMLHKGVHLTFLASNYETLSDFQSRQRNLEKALEKRRLADYFFSQIPIRNSQINNLEKIGELYFKRFDFEKSKKFYNKAGLYCRLLGKKNDGLDVKNPSSEIIYRNASLHFASLNDFKSASLFRAKALIEAKKTDIKPLYIAHHYLNIGTFLYKSNEFEKAFNYYKKAQDYSLKLKESEKNKFPAYYLENKIKKLIKKGIF